MAFPHHTEHHAIQRSGWLRASVLGANDGIISVTSLIMGMAASGASSHTLFITCVAGLISGATSMAAGEYISVKSQEDIEKSDLAIEAKELKKYPQKELDELTQIYISRGLSKELAKEVLFSLRLMMLWVHMPEMKSVFMKIRRQTQFKQHSPQQHHFHLGHFSLCLPFCLAQSI